MPFEQRVRGAEFVEDFVVGHAVFADRAIRLRAARALQHLPSSA